MVLGPLVQKMEIIAVYVVNPAHCLSFRYVVVRHRQAHIRDELSGGIIRTQAKELRREVDHVTFLLTAEADEILIDLHAWSIIHTDRHPVGFAHVIGWQEPLRSKERSQQNGIAFHHQDADGILTGKAQLFLSTSPETANHFRLFVCLKIE